MICICKKPLSKRGEEVRSCICCQKPESRDGKTCGYCGYIRAIFVQPVLIFWLYTRKQTINTVLFCTVLKAIS